MRELARFGTIAVAVWVLAQSTAQAEKLTHHVNYDERSLATTLWFPDNLDVIRGVLVFTGGQLDGKSGDTQGVADNEFYRRFAESIGFGLLGTQFFGKYTNASDGPGKALLDSLDAMGVETNHPELAHVPLMPQGFSNGGYFSFSLTQFVPKRVIAFVLNKSGFASAEFGPEFLAVPGLLIWGEKEPLENTPTIIHSLVSRGRPEHALWAELREPAKAHEDGEVIRILVPFFADMIAARYPKGATPRDGEVPLIALDETQGWLGDHTEGSVNSNLPGIAAFADYSGDKAAASWLPNESLAKLWRGFVTKTPVLLEAPKFGVAFDAAVKHSARVTGLTLGDTVSFFEGTRALATDVDVVDGEVQITWQPTHAGANGLYALVKHAGEVARTSQPAGIVLYGEPKKVEVVPDAGPAADGGEVNDAGEAPDGGEPNDGGVAVRPARRHRRESSSCNVTRVGSTELPLGVMCAAAGIAYRMRRRRAR